MPNILTPIEVFCCYCHADEAWLRKLEIHLSLLKRQGLVALWHDRLVAPGTAWAQAVDEHLETASVILLLVSADFLASDYCYGVAMKRAMARQEAGEARIIPILVRPVDWHGAPFAHLQALPTDGRQLEAWESQETGLADVAAGIRRVIEDMPMLSASASRAALPAIWNIPYPRNPFFLGRDRELAQVHSHLQAGQATALSQPRAISGLGGIGKTQLALEYAYRYHQDYHAVLWAHAESRETLVSSYVALATLLQLPARDTKEEDITVQAVKRWLQTHRGWLLILDNADELALLSDFLPASMGGHLLLTTRAAAAGRLASLLSIETLPPEQGALFLLRRAALLEPAGNLEQASQEERGLALQIAEELGGLPLALDQAGAYLEETGMSLSSYRHIYQQYRRDLLGQRGGLVADHPTPVAATWSLSFARVREKNPAATELLKMLAFLSPYAIAEEILTADMLSLGPELSRVAGNDFLFNQAIEALRAYSMIRRDPEEKTLSVHRLVQAVLRDALSETDRRMWVERVVHSVNVVFPDSEYGCWPQCERLLTQALATAQLVEQYQIRSLEAGSLFHKTASYLYDRGRYPEAEELYQRALAIREQQLGASHPDVAYTLNSLANLYSEQGKYAEAEALYKRALAIREQQLGASHPDVTYPLNGLANLYYEQGKYAEAEELYQRALAIREQQLGADHPSVATSLNDLADLYYEQGKYAEAERLYERALAIFEQQLVTSHPDVGYPLTGLANLYSEQGKYGEAEELYQRALAIREQRLGTAHSLVADPLTGLAVLYSEQGKYAEAEVFYRRALAIFEQQFWGSYPDVAYPLTSLADLYREQGKDGEAEALYKRALTIREQQLGASHLYMAFPLEGLADLYREQGKDGEAEALYKRALAIREQLGTDHPWVASLLNGLASLYREQGKYGKAERLYERALLIREQVLGPQHPATAETMHDLARLWEAQGNSEEARVWYTRALAVRSQALSASHPKTMETRKCLVALLYTMGRDEEAADLEAVQAEL
jgi:tetratricopeptide (TPR) repeat protein